MELVLAAIVGAVSSIFLALIGQYGARKAGLGLTQDKLISNLQGLVATLEKSSAEQDEKIKSQDVEIGKLKNEVKELKILTVEQAELIRKLLSKRKIVIQNNTHDEIPS